MKMADNLTLAPKEVLCALINRNNTAQGAALTPALVDFGLPTQSAGAKNTDITVTAVVGSGYSGAEVINYDRVHLQTDVADAFVASGAGRDMVFAVGDATLISEIVTELNARLGINLTADDFVDGSLPEFTGAANEELDVQVVAKADSLCYRGSLTFKLKAEDIPLSSVIVTKVLNGLTYAPPA
jgi:hypothetical protein